MNNDMKAPCEDCGGKGYVPNPEYDEKDVKPFSHPKYQAPLMLCLSCHGDTVTDQTGTEN